MVVRATWKKTASSTATRSSRRIGFVAENVFDRLPLRVTVKDDANAKAPPSRS